jgi:hypothetical protein
VFRSDEPDSAEVAVANHAGGVPDHRVSRINMGHSEYHVIRGGDCDKLGRCVGVVGQRLLAYHRDALCEERLRHLEMRVVRRDDGDDVHAIIAIGFSLGHVAVVVVDPLDAKAFGKLC